MGRFSKAALMLGFVVLGLSAAASVQAQQPAASPAVAAATDAKAELKSRLSDLSTIYQNEVQRLEKRHEQSKGLYTDGLISRVEFENGEKELEAARAKVESVAKEIALANQPAPALIATPDGGFAIASNLAWTTGNNRVDGLIRQYGTQYGVDPYLIYCLMSQESSFISSAISSKGAQGLMQLMPGTAARYGVTNPYDVAQNIKGGTRYLKDLLQMFNGRVDLALAGYNAGEGAVMKYGNKIPPYDETQNYVRLILKRYTKKPAS
ncbi:MAG TPA: lytic transglycosylase domain-containing protein [Pyrinomonadaceae bacterium]|nr:lytic transglycosylase domain-containing protein [Pyrinomonadaceae bacterium]